jgi:hypothetical protein
VPVIPSAIIPSTVVPAPVIVTIAPVGTIIPAVIGVPWIIAVIGIWARAVIAWSVEDRKWYRERKGKVHTRLRRRFGEERQSSDHKNEDNELLHKERDVTNLPRIQEIGRRFTFYWPRSASAACWLDDIDY